MATFNKECVFSCYLKHSNQTEPTLLDQTNQFALSLLWNSTSPTVSVTEHSQGIKNVRDCIQIIVAQLISRTFLENTDLAPKPVRLSGAWGTEAGRGQLLRGLRTRCLQTGLWDLFREPITDSACTCQDTFATTGVAHLSCLLKEQRMPLMPGWKMLYHLCLVILSYHLMTIRNLTVERRATVAKPDDIFIWMNMFCSWWTKHSCDS